MIDALNGFPSTFVALFRTGADSSRLPANKTRSIISTSTSFVGCNRRIRAQWTRANGLAIDDARGGNRRRRFFRLDPRLDGRNHGERTRAVAAAAVRHAGHHEQTDAVARVPGRLQQAIVVVHRIPRRDAWIAPAVIDEQLAAVRDERREVRIRRIESGLHLVDGRYVRIVVQRLWIPLRVVLDD